MDRNPNAGGNGAEYTPGEVRWTDASDPARNWAMTRRQPIASLLVSGALWGFTRSVPPPPQLIGRRLIITAGADHVPFKDAAPSGQDAVFGLVGDPVSPAEIPKGRAQEYANRVKMLPASVSVGAVRLAAAYIVANVIGDKVYADLRPGTAYSLGPRGRALGIWQEFDEKPMPLVERIERGRWLWCFDAAHEFDLDFRVPVKGFGGLWDYQKGLDLRAGEA